MNKQLLQIHTNTFFALQWVQFESFTTGTSVTAQCIVTDLTTFVLTITLIDICKDKRTLALVYIHLTIMWLHEAFVKIDYEGCTSISCPIVFNRTLSSRTNPDSGDPLPKKFAPFYMDHNP